MNYLLDTHVLLWACVSPDQIPFHIRRTIRDPGNTIYFSIASLWEIQIKHSLRKVDFPYTPEIVREAALAMDLSEMPIEAKHIFKMSHLPPIHRDLFDRILIAQSSFTSRGLLTVDPIVARYFSQT